jgi:hypothetical protein
MAIQHKFVQLVNLQQKLGADITKDASGFWAYRSVMGERTGSYFFNALTLDESAKRRSIRKLRALKKKNPQSTVWQIVSMTEDDKIKRELVKQGIRPVTVWEYFNAVLDSERSATNWIAVANDYIPEDRYVEQRVEGRQQQASKFVRDWIDAGQESLLIVLAPAGHGKTCLALDFVRSLSRAHLTNPRLPIPFFIALHRHPHVRLFEELILTSLEDVGLHGWHSRAFAYLANIGKIVLILDGFDELAETGGPRVARQTIMGLREQLGSSSRTLLTSREVFFRHQADLARDLGRGIHEHEEDLSTVTLEGFNKGERREFWKKFGVENEKAKELESSFYDLGRHTEFLRSPLVCGLIAEATQVGEISSGGGWFGLIQQCLERVAERDIKRQSIPIPVSKQIDIMKDLAELMLTENSYVLTDPAGWLEFIVDGEVTPGLSAEKRKEELDTLVRQLMDHPFLRVNRVGRELTASFLHPLYRDYLFALVIADAAENLSRLLDSLRLTLSETTVAFLSHILDLRSIVTALGDNPAHRDAAKNFFRIVQHKCDAASSSDRRLRTEALSEALGDMKNFAYWELSDLTIRLLDFEDCSFDFADMRRVSFQKCILHRCTFEGTLLANARFFDCISDKATGERLRALGVQGIRIEAQATTVSTVDPVKYLLTRFFRRFIRVEGQNQRSRVTATFSAGLGGEEWRFTMREILPLMRKLEVIEEGEVGRGLQTFIFNADWQTDGDSLIFHETLSPRLARIALELKEAAGRYSIA